MKLAESNIVLMKKLFLLLAAVVLTSCSTLRSREGCLNFTNNDYRPHQSEEYDFKIAQEKCYGQHKIQIDRQKFLIFRREKELAYFKKTCTCEEGFSVQSAPNLWDRDHVEKWAKNCQQVSMEEQFKRGVELAKLPDAPKRTEDDYQKGQSVSFEVAHFICSKK